MLTLVPGEMGGSEAYSRELVGELVGRNLDVSTLVAPVGRGFGAGVPQQVAAEFPTGMSSASRVRALVLSALRRKQLQRYTRDASVVHFPFTVRVPATLPAQRSVVTLHDVQHHDLPQFFSRAERLYRAA